MGFGEEAQKMAKKNQPVTTNTLVFSYLTLRKVIGVLGTVLPFVLYIGERVIFGKGLQASLSGYYYTDMRNVFVGTLFAIGFFLISYRGYELADNIAGALAFVFALGVALFPTTPEGVTSGPERTTGYIHFFFATAMFVTLIYFCLVLFVKTDPRKKPTPQKLKRNKVYIACGVIMAICIAMAALHALLLTLGVTTLDFYSLLFWLESIAIIAFGISWLTKGEAILRDGP